MNDNNQPKFSGALDSKIEKNRYAFLPKNRYAILSRNRYARLGLLFLVMYTSGQIAWFFYEVF